MEKVIICLRGRPEQGWRQFPDVKEVAAEAGKGDGAREGVGAPASRVAIEATRHAVTRMGGGTRCPTLHCPLTQ